MLTDNASSISAASVTDPRVTQVDGFFQDNVAANQTNVEITRAWGRFKTARAGQVVGLMVMLEASQVRTAGTLTVTVYTATVNTTTGVRTETATSVVAVLNATNPAYTIVGITAAFDAGSEVYPKITTDGSWAPTTADVKVVILVEA